MDAPTPIPLNSFTVRKNEFEIRNLCPIIGMISSGKSSILNAIFNFDFLETSAGVTTKFVTIIKFNPEIKDNPKFFHLTLEKDDLFKGYYFNKKIDSEIYGKENIKKEVKRINDKFKKEMPSYDDLFYMLEIGESNFIEGKFINEYNLVDIPGVTEYINNQIQNNCNQKDLAPQNLTVEEEMRNYNIDKERNYLTEIFKRIKNKIKTGIFIFSVDNYKFIENYKIIGKLRVILNKPIENYLFLLNKMDKSENIKEDINSLIQKILYEFPNCDFNPTKNTFLYCSSFQLENELKMKNDFFHLFYYLYINYIMISKKYNNFMEYFKEYLVNHIEDEYKSIDAENFKNIINSIIKEQNFFCEIKKIIQKIKNNHDISKFKLGIIDKYFDEESINDSLDNIEEDEKIRILELNDDLLILYYYYLFKEKKIQFHMSKETRKIIEYFTVENMNKKINNNEIEQFLIKYESRDLSLNKKINDILNKLVKFNEKYINSKLKKKEGYKISMEKIIRTLKVGKLFFIPLLGAYNAGKSTILNDLIGVKLLPTNISECTKRGILIRLWDNDIPILRKADFIIENKDKKNEICYFVTNEDIIAEGVENIKKVLKGLNGEFIENEKNFFYQINIKIKLKMFENELDPNLIEKICFIDLPGYGTKNIFEKKNIYSKLIKSCKMFIMVAKNNFNESKNIESINNILKTTSEFTGFAIQTLIKKFLFIINRDKNLNIDQSSLLGTKKSLIKNVNGLEEKDIRYINLTFINAKQYENYLDNKRYFGSCDYFFENIEKKYNKEKDLYQNGNLTTFEKNFSKYLYKELKSKFEQIFNIKVTDEKIKKEEIVKIIGDYLNQYNEEKNLKITEKRIKDIKQIFSYANKNIENCQDLSLSNYSDFYIYLLHQIISIYKDSFMDFITIINNNLFDLKTIFNNDYENNNCKEPVYLEIKQDMKNKKDNFEKEIDGFITYIDACLYKNNIPKIIEKYTDKIVTFLQNEKLNIKNNLKTQNYEQILSKIENIPFKEEIKSLNDEIIRALEESSDNINKYYNKSFDLINKYKVNKNNEHIIAPLKDYISNQLGERYNYKEAINNIMNDVITNSKDSIKWENSKFTDFIGYKFSKTASLSQILDAMIQNSSTNLTKFKNKIDGIIEDYIEEIKNKIKIQKEGCIENLEKQIKIEEETNNEFTIRNQKSKEIYESQKKDEIEKKRFGMIFAMILKRYKNF